LIQIKSPAAWRANMGRNTRGAKPMMTLAAIFYVGGVTLISVAFPTLLVGMWAWDRARLRTTAAPAPGVVAETPPMRKAA
jgi:hypothetical protein